MRQPLLTRVSSLPDESGGKYYYIETDFVVTNLLQRHKDRYGKAPHVWHKYQSSGGNPDFFERVSTMLYLNQHWFPTSTTYSFVPIGEENAQSLMCGDEDTAEESQRVLEFETNKYTGVTNYQKPIYVTKTKVVPVDKLANPILRRAGVVSMAYETRSRGQFSTGSGFQGVGSLGGVAVSFSGDQGFNYNAGVSEILAAWNTYVAVKESGIKDTGQLIYKDKFGSTKKLSSFRDLQEAFPKWFLVNNEFLAESFLGIIGSEKIVQINGKTYPSSYVGLWQKFSEEGLSERQIVEDLKAKGYTNSQINATRIASGLSAYDLRLLEYTSALSGEALKLAPLSNNNNPNNPSSGGSGGGGSGGSGVSGGARRPNGSSWLGPEGYRTGEIQQITVGRSRNIFLTSDQIRTIVSYENQQQVMYQVYVGNINAKNEMVPVLTHYKFDFAPNEINYSGFGGEWMNIERSGSFPIIDWKSFKLLQISFSFVIANNNNDFTADGLELPVTEQIKTLQRMAQAPYPVMFYGFDTLLTNQFRYDSSGNPRGVQFVIQDLSITSQRRNKNMEITRAQATITLQEIPVETTNIIGMPRLRHKPEVPKTPVRDIADPEFGLATESLIVQGSDTITYRA